MIHASPCTAEHPLSHCQALSNAFQLNEAVCLRGCRIHSQLRIDLNQCTPATRVLYKSVNSIDSICSDSEWYGLSAEQCTTAFCAMATLSTLELSKLSLIFSSLTLTRAFNLSFDHTTAAAVRGQASFVYIVQLWNSGWKIAFEKRFITKLRPHLLAKLPATQPRGPVEPSPYCLMSLASAWRFAQWTNRGEHHTPSATYAPRTVENCFRWF